MLKETIVTGATIEEAIANGCAALGLSEDDVSIEVLEYPQKKTFGLFGGSLAKVRVWCDDGTDEPEYEDEAEDEPEEIVEPEPSVSEPEAEEEDEAPAVSESKPQPASTGDYVLIPMDEASLEPTHQAVIAANYLRRILHEMKLDGVVVELMTEEGKDGAVLNLTGSGLGGVIGRRGETLAALQYLVSLAANNGDDDYYRVAINIGNYREKRETALETLAKKTALRAVKIGKNLALEPMNPFERRIVHTAVQSIEGATSWSYDEGARRHVVIGPVGENEGEDGLPVNFNRKRSGTRSRNSSYRGGYNGNRGYNGGRGGYNRGSNDVRTRRNSYGGGRGGYNQSRSSAPVNTTPRRDTTAPLYGRIEVPKRDDRDNGSEE